MSVFGGLTVQQKDSLANILKLKSHVKKEVIAKEGEVVKKYYFLESG